MHRSIVKDVPGHPVAAPCAIEYCKYFEALDATRDLSAKLQYLVDMLDERGQLEDHVFTFPDGDVWEAGNKQEDR